MEMRRIWTLLIGMLLVAATIMGAMATDDDIGVADGSLGDLSYQEGIESLGFFNSLKYKFSGSQSLTVVGGAACSVNPDFSKDYTLPDGSTGVCMSNSKYTGIVWQMFEVNDGWTFLGEKKIPLDGRMCFSGMDPTKDYHYDVYYCDNSAERTCSDSDGGKDYAEKGTTTFTLEGQSTTAKDNCQTDKILQEIYCDADNSIASVTKTCDGVCSDGECVASSSSSSSSTQTKITLKDITVTNNGDLGINQKYEVKGKAYIEGQCDGCVIETGQGYYGQTLSIAQYASDNGVCGDDKTAGIKFEAQDEWIEFTIADIATKEGSYNVEIAAYNGCYKDLTTNLRKLDSESFKLSVSGLGDDIEGGSDNTEDDDTANDVTCHFCKGDIALSATYDNECPDGTFTEALECGTGSLNEPDCDNEPDAEACTVQDGSEGGTTEEDPVASTDGSAITGNVVKKYFDYDSDPVTAWTLTFIIGGLVLVLLFIVGYALANRR